AAWISFSDWLIASPTFAACGRRPKRFPSLTSNVRLCIPRFSYRYSRLRGCLLSGKQRHQFSTLHPPFCRLGNETEPLRLVQYIAADLDALPSALYPLASRPCGRPQPARSLVIWSRSSHLFFPPPLSHCRPRSPVAPTHPQGPVSMS